MIFDVTELENQEKYRLLTGGIIPRPIAWISTRSAEGVDNLAPYSFFTVASCNPPVLLYTQVTQRSGIDKDTLQNLLATKQCVVNIVSADLIEKMNQTSASLAHDESEFDFAGIESCASHLVSPRSVQDSLIRYECTLRETLSINHTSMNGLPAGDAPINAMGGTVIMLDVTSIYVRDDLYDNGIINQHLVNSVGKMGSDFFSLTSEMLELQRP
jgi:flavin reductase (DIM6/NTAB) family NADH-FMN oxidoreductase RutF